MKLTDLNPEFLDAYSGNPPRTGVAVVFDCPCGCDDRVYIPMAPALDGSPATERAWARTGDTFETITLSPSIQRMDGCKWHGFITNGEVRNA